MPGTPADLAGYEGIRMSNVAGSDMLDLLGPGGTRNQMPFGGRLRVDHGLAAREALLAGRGIALAHLWLIDDLLAAGRLVPVLSDYAPHPVPFSMLIAPERAGVARISLFADFVTHNLGKIPGIAPHSQEQRHG